MEWKQLTETKYRYFLFPLALLYWGVLIWRNLFYSAGFFVTRKLPVKVISVGNITIGGTGKTPTVIYLAKTLLQSGHRVAVLSRGYGRKTAGTQLVTDGVQPVSDWRNYGDEPTMMAEATSDIPIVVDSNRHRGGLFLIDRFNPEIIIMDDAFQHRAIERDVDIVLINSQDTWAKHKLLPYGLLREPWASLKRADVIIFTKTNLKTPAPFLKTRAQKTKKPILESRLNIGVPKKLTKGEGELKKGTKAVAVAAIGDPGGFVCSLKKREVVVVDTLFFTDHHHYIQSDIPKIKAKMEKASAEIVITTEKDAIKLKNLKIDGLNIYTLGVQATLSLKEERKLLNIIQR